MYCTEAKALKCFWIVVPHTQWSCSAFWCGSADPSDSGRTVDDPLVTGQGWLLHWGNIHHCVVSIRLTLTETKIKAVWLLHLGGISSVNHQYFIKATDVRPDVEKMHYCFHNKQTGVGSRDLIYQGWVKPETCFGVSELCVVSRV